MFLQNDFQMYAIRRMLPTCGGGCPKEWEEGRIPCPTPKFNIEQRMVLSYLKKNHSHVLKIALNVLK